MKIIITSLVLLLCQPGYCVCDDSNEELVSICSKLFQQFESSLNTDERNLYRLRKAFFYSPSAKPVLMRVIYTITYSHKVAINIGDCFNSSNTSYAISINNTTITYGWTSTGVFTVFHPLTLNFMQMQLPFLLLRAFLFLTSRYTSTEGGPEALTFLWDATYELPTLYLNLSIMNLPCVPSVDIFLSALKDFNSMLRVYAGKGELLQDSGNTHLVGFTLPEAAVSGQEFRDDSYVPFYLIYVLSSVVLYVICVTTAFSLASDSNSKGVKSFTKDNREVLQGLSIVMSVFIVLEIITEVVMAIIWSVAVKDGVIAFNVSLSTIVYCFPGIISVVYVTHKRCYCNQRSNTDNHIPISLVLLASYFAYLLLYSFFPAFILAYAYPVRVVSVFVFMATFMILFILYVITFIKSDVKTVTSRTFKFLKLNLKFDEPEWLSVVTKAILGLFFTLTLLYLFLLVFGLLYSLIIGKASVVSSAPLALLSLIPSILISIASWIIRSTILKGEEENKKTNGSQATTSSPDSLHPHAPETNTQPQVGED